MTQDRSTLPELPQGWVRTTIGEVVTFEYGKGLTKAKRDSSGDVPVYGSNGMVGCHSESLVDEPCLIVGRKGAVGQVHISSGPCWPIDTTYYVIPPEGIDLSFLCYLLSTVRLGALDKSTTIPGLNRNDAYALPIPLPPTGEQHRIVAKIEELFTQLDAGVAALGKAKVQLRRYRQAALKAAMGGELTKEWREAHQGELEAASMLLERIKEEREKEGEKVRESLPLDTSDLPGLPEGWVWARVSDIGDVVTGRTPRKSKPEYYGKDFPFYKPADLNAGYHTRQAKDGLSRLGAKQARLLPAKSTLVTCIGATIGKTGFGRTEGATNQQINAVVPEKSMVPEFVYFVCVSPRFQQSIIDNASATTLPILNKTRFKDLLLPVAPQDEQQVIVEEIERRLSVADEVERAIGQSMKRAERLRQSILEEAFEGNLVPQDPTDEPASGLLERIKAEKADARRRRN